MPKRASRGGSRLKISSNYLTTIASNTTGHYVTNWPFDAGTTSTTMQDNEWVFCSNTSSSYTITQETVWEDWMRRSRKVDSMADLSNYRRKIWREWEKIPHPNGYCKNTRMPRPDGVDRSFVFDRVHKDWVSEEDYARRQIAREAAANEKRAREQAEHEAAAARAEELLLSILPEEEKKRYASEGVVHVTCQSGRRYELKRGWAGNVAELDKKGKRTRRFCIHPRVSLPEADNMVAQILMLQNDEEEFLRVANASVVR